MNIRKRPPKQIIVDPARLAYGPPEGDISAAYSADTIADYKNSAIRRPFEHAGKLWVNTGSGFDSGSECYVLTPVSRWVGRKTNYRKRTSTMRAAETARNDPMGFYHGMQVRHGSTTYVITGPRVMFVGGEVGEIEKIASRQNMGWLMRKL